jgi:hypothetical protein
MTEGKQVGPWKRVSVSYFSSSIGGPFPLPISIPISFTVSVIPASASSIASSFGATVGATYTTAVPRQLHPVPIMLPNKYCWMADQPFWDQLIGTASNYENQGYVGQATWTLNKPFNAINPFSDYNEQMVMSDSPPLQ